MTTPQPIELIYSLVGYPHETEWLEFKTGNNDPERIGKDISALSNTAAWLGRDKAYKIWGVDDSTRELVGTDFDPLTAKGKGNQDLLIWLKLMLTPNANYEFKQFTHDGKHFVVLVIHAAINQPVCFKKQAYIREGTSTTTLEAGSTREAELWRRLQRSDFEERNALENVSLPELVELLNIDAYYRLLGLRLPTSHEASIISLLEQGLVKDQDNGLLSITNLGALLIAKRLSSFPTLKKRPLRILTFSGKGSREILADKTFDEGYATAISAAQEYILTHIAIGEQSDGALRLVQYEYPQKAIRELLTNVIMHQDLNVATQGPLICIYQNRIEFSNPGISLVRPDRILNAQPKTRNAALAGILRQMDLCEEGGTGWDIAVAACEDLHMLPPKITTSEDLGTNVTLFKGLAYDRMTKRERLDALYWHACLRFADGEAMSNQSLRKRFGLGDDNKSSLSMSRLIREGCNEHSIKIEDESSSTKNRRYIPFWA
ncbi:MAG: ATP-binding protein [Coriobacteriales bacterium]|nr:ATP-binding protein [Coriobacteriales bacterium]